MLLSRTGPTEDPCNFLRAVGKFCGRAKLGTGGLHHMSHEFALRTCIKQSSQVQDSSCMRQA